MGDMSLPGSLSPISLTFLNHIQQLVGFLQSSQQSFLLGDLQHKWVCSGGAHTVPPRLIDSVEALALSRHLRFDVVRAEDWLEIQPCALSCDVVWSSLT